MSNENNVVDDEFGGYSKTAWYFVPDNSRAEVLTEAEVHYWDGKKEMLRVPNLSPSKCTCHERDGSYV